MSCRVAIIGATAPIGREIVKTLAERGFPVREALALGAGKALGQQLSFGDDVVLTVRALDKFDFAGTTLAFFAGPEESAPAEVARATAAGCIVIDCTDRFRMEPGVPLVIPEVNPQAVAALPKRRIIANPRAASIALLMALKPLHDLARALRVSVASYQPVAEAGKPAMDELWSQTRASFVNEMPPAEIFPKQIAFNVIPQVTRFRDDGATAEEWALGVEARKILDPDVALFATCVRVPVFIGLGLAVQVQFDRPISEAEARAAWRAMPGVTMLDTREEGGYTTPAETAGEDSVYLSRLRRDPTVPHGLGFWCACDNFRKGSALNAVQIAELLLRQNHLG